MTTQEQHNRLHHDGGSGPCPPGTCPPDWPLDLGPQDCRACYDEHGPHGLPRGVAVPVEQCTRHRGGRIA